MYRHSILLFAFLLLLQNGCSKDDKQDIWEPPGTDDSAQTDFDSATGGDTGNDTGNSSCQNGFAFSFIWIANTQDGTLTKIDTTNEKEVARYITSPFGAGGDPSRTSVNLFGDMVVTNIGLTCLQHRLGGVFIP